MTRRNALHRVAECLSHELPDAHFEGPVLVIAGGRIILDTQNRILWCKELGQMMSIQWYTPFAHIMAEVKRAWRGIRKIDAAKIQARQGKLLP